jgi:hypothetical protein
MSTKASRISNTGRKWINQSATKGNNMKYPQDKTKRDKDNKSNRLEWCGPKGCCCWVEPYGYGGGGGDGVEIQRW